LEDSKLIDRYKRNLNYLRVSITDRCNLHCIYCVPRELIPKCTHKEILRYEEILRLIRIGVQLGVTKVRVTGGEPLVRKGVYGFLEELTAIEGLTDVSLTTNGILLKKNIRRIKSSGIKRINISLDTLNREKFQKITGHDRFHEVWKGIELAHEMGFEPVKINVVVMKDVNDDEIEKIAELSVSYPFHIRFIEHMPLGKTGTGNNPGLLAPEIKSRVSALGELVPIGNGQNDGPAERYKFEGAKGEIGFILPISHHFCDKCNRLRLTASGQLRPCLLFDYQEDLKGPLRKGCLDQELVEIFIRAIRSKPFEHNLSIGGSSNVHDQMCAIGG